ncbi:hypothetical protein BX666DRAFT_1864358 [Dichotomocladium elegans]|nr:hypothetical protein BX666DRAFT_1864358 [Dichotomocladium elegans]
MWIEERVSGSSVNSPRFSLCCSQGAVSLPQWNSTPQEIRRLLHGSDARSKDFRTYIRAYNSALSFTSMGISMDHSVANSHGGAYNFRIHGSIYHRIGSLFLFPANENNQPAFAQIYVHDPATELQVHENVINAHLRRETLEELQDMMHRISPLLQSFKSMAEIARSDGDFRDVAMIIRAENTPDPRQYNRPNDAEIGIFIVENPDHEDIGNRDIVIRTRSNELQQISEMHRFYDALHYVLIFPEGSLTLNSVTFSISHMF